MLSSLSAVISPAGSTPAVGLLLRQDHAILGRNGPHRDGEHDPSAHWNDAIHLSMQPEAGLRGMDKAFVIDCSGSRAEPPFKSGSRKLRLPLRSLASQVKVRAQPKVTAPVEKYKCGCASQLVR